jgi:hypothetical protein
MDRTSKLLLAAIVVGLFLNAGVNMVRTASANPTTEYAIQDMAAALSSIAIGTCKNSKLC